MDLRSLARIDSLTDAELAWRMGVDEPQVREWRDRGVLASLWLARLAVTAPEPTEITELQQMMAADATALLIEEDEEVEDPLGPAGELDW